MFLSLTGIGVDCLGALGVGFEGDSEAAEFGGGITGGSPLLFFGGVVMIAAGFLMKAFGPDH